MKMYLLDCPACGAQVEIEHERKSCFCTHCGRKIYLDDGTKRVEITKDIKYHKTYTDEAKIKEIESRERIYEKELAKDKAFVKQKNKQGIITTVCVVVGIIFVISLFGLLIGSQKKASDEEEMELQRTIEEILQDIEKSEYDVARIKAESLYYTSNWSDEIEDKWDSIRKELLKQIDEAEKASEAASDDIDQVSNKDEETGGGKWWNPFD